MVRPLRCDRFFTHLWSTRWLEHEGVLELPRNLKIGLPPPTLNFGKKDAYAADQYGRTH